MKRKLSALRIGLLAGGLVLGGLGAVTVALLRPAPGRLSTRIQVKPTIMAATYKVYADRTIGEGAYWLARVIATNTGERPLRDLSIRCRVPGYTEWETGERYPVVHPGSTVVHPYFPILSATITSLKTRAPATVDISLTYTDAHGRRHTETVTRPITIFGLNQFEYSSLTEEENTGTWYDNFSNANLLAAYVTRADPPVKAFAGLVSRSGVPSALSDEAAVRFLRDLFDAMIVYGFAYQTPSGFLIDRHATQDIKFPRDVLRDRSGTCIDLAIFYAAVCEAVGLKSTLMLIPGHCFPVIDLPSGTVLPVEATMIGGEAMGRKSFDDAVKQGMQTLQENLAKPHYLIDVTSMWQAGIVNPELPSLPPDILKRWGYRAVRHRKAVLGPGAGAFGPAVPGGRLAGPPAAGETAEWIPGEAEEAIEESASETSGGSRSATPSRRAGTSRAPAPRPAGLEGSWHGTITDAAGASGPFTLVLTVDGDSVTGIASGDTPCKLSGKVRGTASGGTVDLRIGRGWGCKVRLTGRYDGHTLEGAWDYPVCLRNSKHRSGSFQLTR